MTQTVLSALLLVSLAPAAGFTAGVQTDARLRPELCMQVASGRLSGAGPALSWHEALVPGFPSPLATSPDSAEPAEDSSPETLFPGSASAAPRASVFAADLHRGRELLLAGRAGEAWALLGDADPGDGGEDAFVRAWAAYAAGAPEAGRLLAPFAEDSLPLPCRAAAARAAAGGLAAAGDSAGARRLLEALEVELPEIRDYVLLWRLEAASRTAGAVEVEPLHRALVALDPPAALLREADGALARTLDRAGDGRRAESLLEKLLPRVPRRERPPLLLELAHVEGRLGDAAAAERRLREIVARHPESAEAWKLIQPEPGVRPAIALSTLERAAILAGHGLAREAVGTLGGASDPELLARRAEIRLRDADYAGAAADFGEAIERGGDPEALGMEQAKAYGRGGEPARAREIYRRLLEGMAKGSRAAELTYLIADSFQDEAAAVPSLADSAAVWFRMLVDRFPRAELAPRALVRLAHLRFSRSEWVAADSLFREYLARYPRGEDARAARYWGARSTLAAGRPDEARQLFGELLDTTPPDYYALLARRRMGGAGDVAVEELFRGGARAFDQSVAPEAADTLLPAGGPGSRELARARALLLVGEVAAAQLEIDEAVRLSGKSREELSRVARWALAWDYPESAFRVGAALLESEDEEQTARLAYPAAFPGYVMLEGLEAGLPPALLWAIVRQESSFDPAARSPVGAAGLLQLMPATARAEVARLGLASFETSDLDRPESNLHLGAAHLRDLVDRLDGDRVAAIAAYNAGASLASRWRSFPEASDTEAFIERIPFRETRRYVKAVIANQAQYEELYARR